MRRIGSASEREQNRRDGQDFASKPPEAAIWPEEEAVSIDAAIAMNRPGIPGGANIPFSVTGSGPTLFSYDSRTHVLTIGDVPEPTVPEPGTLALFGIASAALAWRRRSR